MALSDPKRIYINRMRETAKLIAEALNEAEDIRAIFLDREYDLEAEVTDADLAEWDLSRARVMTFVSACAQLVNLRDNQPVTQGDWGAAINVVRTS